MNKRQRKKYLTSKRFLREWRNLELVHKKWESKSEEWDHDHCLVCLERISEYEGELHEGYCIRDKDTWVCEKCFNSFKDECKWKVVL